MRVALRLAYDGTRFASYARNPGTQSIEAAVIAALAREGFVADSFRAGSRTDAGVSALENVCAADLDRPHMRGLIPAVQSRLPPGVWVTGAAVVAAAWNPRHAAWRRYRLLHPTRGEDLDAMRKAAALFVGSHDMTAFARVEAGRDPQRSVDAFSVTRAASLWSFRVRGESFLWGQVRRMVGAVLSVGRGDATTADITRALATGKAHPRFVAAPAEGLVLERVAYRGLKWDASAGRIADAADDVVAARARMAVAQHVASLRKR